MFHTLTLNPSLDYLLAADTLAPGTLNRAQSAQLFAGGKGINLALMLARLGQPARALGFFAGPTGRVLKELLAAEGLCEALLPLAQGATRINLKWETPETETELNAPGPAPDAEAMTALERQLAAIPPGDTLAAAGSLPAGLEADTYARLLAPLAARGVRCVLDTSGEPLAAGLAARPFLIKPNLAELAGLTGQGELAELVGQAAQGGRPAAAGDENATSPPGGLALPKGGLTPAAAAALQEAMQTARALGAQNVLVSLGSFGAALLAQSGAFFFQPAPAGRPVNTAGAGDSLLAGFLAGLARGESLPDALRLGVAAGSATAFSPWLADAETTERLLAGL